MNLWKSLQVAAAVLLPVFASAGVGDWTLSESKELEQTSMATPQMLVFGDEKWKDYELECEAKKLSGEEGFILVAHFTNMRNGCWWNVGGFGNRADRLECLVNGKAEQFDRGVIQPFTPVQTGKWYRLRLRVQGSRYEGWINDEKNFECIQEAHPEGKVGIGTWNTLAVFRNITVRDEEGKVIYQGVPDPADTQPKP